MSTVHENERLLDLLLGALGDEERAQVEAHVASCPACARRHAELATSVGELPLSLPRAAVPKGLRNRLDASIDHLERFAPFAPRLAELLGLPKDEARRALHVYESPLSMPPTARPGMRAVPIQPGPGVEGVTAILAWFEPGAIVASHTHPEEERIFVFEGAFACDDGKAVGVGQELVSAIGTTHLTKIIGDGPCSCAIIKTAHDGWRPRFALS